MVTNRDLRHPVYVEKLADGTDYLGGPLTTYSLDTTIGQPWRVKLEPLSGRELVASRAMHADVTHKVTGRWITGLTSAHRLRTKVGNRILHIREVRNVGERGEWAELVCTETV